jgi:diaminopimelate epimerase
MHRFTKYHGLGNDFLVVDGRGMQPPFPNVTAIAMCNRRFGIGADGVLVVEHPTARSGATVRMRIINPDGTEPEMCGNGLRCFVKHVVDRLELWSNPLDVQTDAGVRSCAWTRGPDGLVDSITVSMGAPVFDPVRVPMADAHGTTTPLPLGIVAPGDPVEPEIDGVSMGNPHGIVFGSADQELALRLGPRIQQLPLFPEGVNVNFAEVRSPTDVRLVVYERGCGLTLACGTGASATVSAAIRRGLSSFDQDVRVELPGGALTIRVLADFADVLMTGPATLVCDGDSYL